MRWIYKEMLKRCEWFGQNKIFVLLKDNQGYEQRYCYEINRSSYYEILALFVNRSSFLGRSEFFFFLYERRPIDLTFCSFRRTVVFICNKILNQRLEISSMSVLYISIWQHLYPHCRRLLYILTLVNTPCVTLQKSIDMLLNCDKQNSAL